MLYLTPEQRKKYDAVIGPIIEFCQLIVLLFVPILIALAIRGATPELIVVVPVIGAIVLFVIGFSIGMTLIANNVFKSVLIGIFLLLGFTLAVYAIMHPAFILFISFSIMGLALGHWLQRRILG